MGQVQGRDGLARTSAFVWESGCDWKSGAGIGLGEIAGILGSVSSGAERICLFCNSFVSTTAAKSIA